MRGRADNVSIVVRPSPVTVKVLQWSMILIGLCSLIGIYEHMINNFEFQLEIQPNATTWELIRDTQGCKSGFGAGHSNPGRGNRMDSNLPTPAHESKTEVIILSGSPNSY